MVYFVTLFVAPLFFKNLHSFSESETILHSTRREELINQITLGEAIIARNEAQIESFVDEQHQWEEQDEVDRAILTALPALQAELDELDKKGG